MANKITKAKVGLILTQPFFATLALGMKYIEDATIETACTNGQVIKYNPEFIDKISLEETKGLIAHEVMHVAMCHHTRQNGRDADKWNVACDYAINQMLIDSGFKLPEGGCIDSQYKNMSAEEIYNKLPNQPKDKKGNSPGNSGNDPGGNGGVSPAPGNSQADLNQAEAEAKQLLAQAATIAKQQGKLPAHLARLVEEMLEAKVNWKDILNVFLTEITRNDYTFKRPSPRYIDSGLYLPSLESIEKGKFVMMVDTSGSIDNKLLNEFAGEMQSILADSAQSLSVMYIDAELNHIEEFESDDVLKLNPKGGGGTDFRPGFDYLDENAIEPACVVYFTDGYCNSFPTMPDYPVIWAAYDNKSFTPPFGEVIHIN